ncbi:NADH-quinone oxidoreductase subunit NuoG [Flavisolibacter nicotianae]|uniref:NADH-quinone oxidoreductase subunit NuoG n=1 Tax=Flavisolibacter nicotianae TaxID=2364882 RepID=UPI000EB55632|nr:NADH-quinone oxidoreductase subunit NuoG [Flavisolibacter nicotianae]
MPVIFIDNISYNVKAGKNLLEASLALGLDLPYFCWHPALGSVGACRQCAVKVFKDENDPQGRLVMSCMEEVKEGLRFSINDKTATAFREQVIEWLMTNHPHDCPVCDEGGSCHLQDMTVMTGHDYRRYRFKKRTYRNQYLGPLVHHEMNRCIQCYRCVRYYRDYAGGKDLDVFAAHNHVYFGRESDGVLESPFSGNLAEVCPTGVFTDKTLKEHYTRKWDLTMAPSVCQHCSVGCNTIAGERYGSLRCIQNRYNSEVNGYFLCDRGRYGYEFVNSENRVTKPLLRNRPIEAVSEQELNNHLQVTLSTGSLIGIGSPRASMESNFALRQLVGVDNFYQGISEDEAYLLRKIIGVLSSGTVHSASLKEIEQADAVLILGEDIWNTAPRMALSVLQTVRKMAAADATLQLKLPQWNDAAIKEFVQQEKGFLCNITLLNSPLDEVAASTLRMAPDDMARLGFAIVNQMDASQPAVDNPDDNLLYHAKSIAAVLQEAKRPVIISGVSVCNEGVINAAYNLAAFLTSSGKSAGLCYVVPECNSMGLAMMQAPSFDKAVRRIEETTDTTVILIENDLYRSIPSEEVEYFFKRCKNLIVLDSLFHRTTEKAQALIPVASFAEGDGTIVNYEGRAQRFYQVFMPSNPLIKETWRWLKELSLLRLQKSNGHNLHPDQLLAELETALPQFSGINQTAPAHNFSIHGERIPREPHRYSGRTAMLANQHVSEPKPLQDDDSPLSFTMEGYKGIPPSSAVPFFWAPGWNSVQAVTRYQEEPGGSLKGGDPGIKLFDLNGKQPTYFKEPPEAFHTRQEKWLLLPHYHVLGSGELSSYTRALQELSPAPYAILSANDAKRLALAGGANIRLSVAGKNYTLPVQLKKELPDGILLVTAGLLGADSMNWNSWIKVEKV